MVRDSFISAATASELFLKLGGTPMAQLNTPLSEVAGVIRVRSEGMGLRSTGRVFGVHKNTVSTWESKFSKQKKPLMLYAICHQFISLSFEGDELYTIVNKRTEVWESEGWTALLWNDQVALLQSNAVAKKPRYVSGCHEDSRILHE